MAKSSINFRPAKITSSEAHNTRATKLDYTYPELSVDNSEWVSGSISDRLAKIEASCKVISGRKLQKNATPIREAVVNLDSHHTNDDLHRLASELREKFKIDCFQFHIHRDEGKSRDDLNYHAHMVFDWQDKDKGSMLRLNKSAMAQIQTLTADVLGMERGKEGSTAVRLEAQAYKAQQEHERLQVEIKAEAQKKTLITDFGFNQKDLNTLSGIDKAQKRKLSPLKKQLESLKAESRTLDQELSRVTLLLKKLQVLLKKYREKFPALTKSIILGKGLKDRDQGQAR